jgi:hypothetical protein
MNKWIRMNPMWALLPVLMMMSVMALAAAPPDLPGMWQGKLAVDAKTSLAIQVTFAKDAKGAYTAVLNSPDNPAIKDTPATDISWAGGTLKFKVPALSGAYAGTLKDGALNGQWTQPGGNLPLVLTPYQKAVVSKQAGSALTGAWSGTMKIAANEVAVQFRFKVDDKGVPSGTFSIPDQGLNDSPLTDVEFANNKLSLRIPRAANSPYTAELVNNQFVGKLKIPAPGAPEDGVPLTLKKGEVAVQVHELKLASQDYAKVAGKWTGKLEMTPPNGQKVTLTLVMRIITNSAGQFVGFLDSPDQKATNIPITEATLAGDKFTAKIAVVRGEFTGTLAGKTLTGQWTQGPQTTPLTFTKE